MFHQSLYFSNVIILTAAGVAGHSLRVNGAKIIAIDDPPQKKDRVIDGQGGLLIPGLINAHDHLELNTFKRLKYRDRYTHSLDWIEDIEARFDSDAALTGPRQQPLPDRLLVSALKNLLSGVTTVCHHNPLHSSLRSGYPIRVVKGCGFCHSLFRGDNPAASYRQTNPNHPWIIHLAEGIDARAEAEFDRLNILNLVRPNTILVHGVGLTAKQRRALIGQGGGLIWCPGSNCFLFGQTAQVQELAEAGKLALGSDSRLSGEFDLLEELRLAYQTNQLTPPQLFEAVTLNPARLLRLQQAGRGQICLGGEADLVLLPPPTSTDPFSALFNLKRSRLELVMVAGKPLAGSPRLRPLFEATRVKPETILVDGVEKLLPQKLVARLRKSSVLEPGLTLF
jgi:cytosine/adenosine deaminase-related metal-dependent hydrolase